jgi:Colicin E5 ribonuclease domain
VAARCVSADAIVPEHGAQTRQRTVSFGEPGLTLIAAQENRARCWFEMDDRTRDTLGTPFGPADPQTLNRYAYVRNNPVRFTDSTGHYVPCGKMCDVKRWLAQHVNKFIAIVLGVADVAIITDKIAKQMPARAWTKELAERAMNDPADTAKTVNKATGNKAIKYYDKDGHYVVGMMLLRR